MSNESQDARAFQADEQGDLKRRALEGATNGGRIAALAVFTVALLIEAGRTARNAPRPSALPRGAAVHGAKSVALQTLDGGIKGSLCGMASACAQAASTRVSHPRTRQLLKGNLPAATTLVLVSLLQCTLKYGSGQLSRAEYRREAGEALTAGIASALGAAAVGALAGPKGRVAGGILAPMLAQQLNPLRH